MRQLAWTVVHKHWPSRMTTKKRIARLLRPLSGHLKPQSPLGGHGPVISPPKDFVSVSITLNTEQLPPPNTAWESSWCSLMSCNTCAPAKTNDHEHHYQEKFKRFYMCLGVTQVNNYNLAFMRRLLQETSSRHEANGGDYGINFWSSWCRQCMMFC
jgi:hypothetical protein